MVLRSLKVTLSVTFCVWSIAGCGGWSAADTKSLTDSVRGQMVLEQMCADAGPCKPAVVRSLERSSICNLSSTLAQHGQAAPDSGISCPAR